MNKVKKFTYLQKYREFEFFFTPLSLFSPGQVKSVWNES